MTLTAYNHLMLDFIPKIDLYKYVTIPKKVEIKVRCSLSLCKVAVPFRYEACCFVGIRLQLPFTYLQRYRVPVTRGGVVNKAEL